MAGNQLILGLCIICYVDSIYIRSIIPSIIYGKDHLSIQCIQENLQHEDSIYKITLSKIVNDIPRHLLEIETDTNSPPTFLKVIWYDNLLKSRSDATQSTLVPSNAAKLVLFMNMSDVSCNDEGMYQCVLFMNMSDVSCNDEGMYQCGIFLSADRSEFDVAPLNITLPDSILNIVDDANNMISGGIIDSTFNDTITLKCMASFLVPSCLQWCLKRQTGSGSNSSTYETDDIFFSKLEYNGCHFTRYSMLHYKVSDDDSFTELACQSSSTACDETHPDKGVVFMRNSEHLNLVSIDIPEVILYRRQSLNIHCLSELFQSNDKIQSLILSKKLSKSSNIIVKGMYNYEQNETEVIWYDKNLEERTEITEVEVGPSTYSSLRIQIQSSTLNCWDAGTYRCELRLSSGKYSVEEKTVKFITSNDFVRVHVNSQITLGIDSLKIGCVTSYFDEQDTVSKIVLSKVLQSNVNKLVMLELDVPSGGFQTIWRWFDLEFKKRVAEQSGNLHPAHLSRMNIHIAEKHVKCSDAGIYVCEVFGSNGKNSHSESSVNITVEQSRTFPIEDKICLDSSGGYRKMQKAILKCNAEVGNPPMIPHWCRRMNSESSFKLYYNKTKIFNNGLKHVECQYEISSTLEYTVTEKDVNTEFICMVSNSPCNNILFKDVYRIKVIRDTDKSHSSAYVQQCFKDRIVDKNKDCTPLYGYITTLVLLFSLCCMCTIYIIFQLYKHRHQITAANIVQSFSQTFERCTRRNRREEGSNFSNEVSFDLNILSANVTRGQLSRNNSIRSDITARECYVCRDNTCDRVLITCLHMFCQNCVETWFRVQGKTCPMCRYPVVEMEHIVVHPKNY